MSEAVLGFEWSSGRGGARSRVEEFLGWILFVSTLVIVTNTRAITMGHRGGNEGQVKCLLPLIPEVRSCRSYRSSGGGISVSASDHRYAELTGKRADYMETSHLEERKRRPRCVDDDFIGEVKNKIVRVLERSARMNLRPLPEPKNALTVSFSGCATPLRRRFRPQHERQ